MDYHGTKARRLRVGLPGFRAQFVELARTQSHRPDHGARPPLSRKTSPHPRSPLARVLARSSHPRADHGHSCNLGHGDQISHEAALGLACAGIVLRRPRGALLPRFRASSQCPSGATPHSCTSALRSRSFPVDARPPNLTTTALRVKSGRLVSTRLSLSLLNKSLTIWGVGID